MSPDNKFVFLLYFSTLNSNMLLEMLSCPHFCDSIFLKCNFCEFSYLSRYQYVIAKALYIHVTLRRYRFLFNNQPDALIIQIYSVIKLYMFRATILPIIRSFLLYIRHCKFHGGFDGGFQAELVCTILTLLGSGNQNRHEIYQCRIYSRKLLMMGKVIARYMYSFMTE